MVRKEIDWAKVETLASLKLSLQVIVDYLNSLATTPEERISHSCLEQRIFQKYGQKFSEFQNARLVNIKAQLVKKAISMALSGDRTLLIFCLKNIVGWQDKIEETHRFEVPEIRLSYATKEEIEELKNKAIETKAEIIEDVKN
jgi:hypothetical protein